MTLTGCLMSLAVLLPRLGLRSSRRFGSRPICPMSMNTKCAFTSRIVNAHFVFIDIGQIGLDPKRRLDRSPSRGSSTANDIRQPVRVILRAGIFNGADVDLDRTA